MDNGVRFVLDNFEKSINICDSVNKDLVRKIKSEYNTIKYIKYTGNMVEYFDKFKNGKHRLAKDFNFLEKYDVLPNEKMSDYLRENYKEELGNIRQYTDIVEGEILAYAETHIYFGGSNQGKVIRRNKKDNIFILTLNETLNHFNEDNSLIVFNYRGVNTNYDESKNLLQYKDLGATIYVFKYKSKNKYIFLGQYDIEGEPYSENGIKYINLRHKKVIQKETLNHYSYLPLNQSLDAIKLPKPSLEEIRYVKANSSHRNQKVSSYTKHRANGKCDLCGKNAPFINASGQPYLECHHIQYIANNGPDRIYNTVALCPNCHKEVHELGESKTKNKLIEKLRNYLLSDKDKKNLELFNELFGFNYKE